MANDKYTVQYLQSINFSSLPLEEKLAIKRAGRPRPEIDISQITKSKNREFKRIFNTDCYNRNDWICGCNVTNRLYCYPCLLFDGAVDADKVWTKIGVVDLSHLTQKMKRHESNQVHMFAQIELKLIRKDTFKCREDAELARSLERHNQQVKKNRYVLSKMLDCLKCFGTSNLVCEEQGDIEALRSLLQFSAEMDTQLKDHLEQASLFKRPLKSIWNDLLNSILQICRERIKSEIANANFLSVIVHDVSDLTPAFRLALILRYILPNGTPVERIWSFVDPVDAADLAKRLKNDLTDLLDVREKLISVSYDGRCLDFSEVHDLLRKDFVNAHRVPYYANLLDSVVFKAANHYQQVRIFYSNLKEIKSFFADPQKVALLNDMIDDRVAPQWNFEDKIFDTIIDNRKLLMVCAEEIEYSSAEIETISAVGAVKLRLQDTNFITWLNFFSRIVPEAESLFANLKEKPADPDKIKKSIERFESHMAKIKDDADMVFGELVKTNCSNSKRIRSDKQQLRETQSSFSDQNRSALVLNKQVTFRDEPSQAITSEVEIKEEVTEIDIFEVSVEENEIKREIFEESVDETGIKLEASSQKLTHGSNKRPLEEEDPRADEITVAKEVCDAIVDYVKNTFSFMNHLCASNLFHTQKFRKYSSNFPNKHFKGFFDSGAFLFLDSDRITTELGIIYCRQDFRSMTGPMAVLKFLIDYKLQQAFSGIFKLLQIIVTMPMITDEPERCFPTLDRIKSFLERTSDHKRLPALAMLSLESNIISDISDFNDKVIEKFCALDERTEDFVYKKI